MRLATKPGRSSLTACSFFMATTSSSVLVMVESSVRNPRITSTRGITGTGFMKCMPMKRSGRSTTAPSLVMEIEDVLLASTLSDRRPASSKALKEACLMLMSSLTASMTKSRPGTWPMAAASSSAPYAMRPVTAATSASLSRPFFSSLPVQSLTNWALFSKLAGYLSSARTSTWACLAATIAMPVPIWPQPTTPIRFTAELEWALA
mmetsp:Transcript_33091/g.89571  ORF Transcript_33091/g.89571 Transcript_33091/m.89571 type:complete len:206 (-) Transcript_33091:95-712(-)